MYGNSADTGTVNVRSGMYVAKVLAMPMYGVYKRYEYHRTRYNYPQDSELPRGRWLCCRLYSIASGCAMKVANDRTSVEDSLQLDQ